MSQPTATVGFGTVLDASKCFCEPPLQSEHHRWLWGFAEGKGGGGSAALRNLGLSPLGYLSQA